MCYKSEAFIVVKRNTVGHIPREITRYVYFFIKEENGKCKYKVSLIPSGGLKFLLSCKEKWVIDTMKEVVENFYNFEYSGNPHLTDDTNDDTYDSDDEEDNDYQSITLETKMW